MIFWVALRRGPQHARLWRDGVERFTAAINLRQLFAVKAEAASLYSFTARSVISNPLSMIANASRMCCSLMHSGGLVKKVFQRTKV